MRRHPALLAPLCLLLGACPSDDPPSPSTTETESSSDATDATSTAPSTETEGGPDSAAMTETSDGSSDETSAETETSDSPGTTETTDGEPMCGDGVLDEQTEECDDGNAVDDDACANDCTLVPCYLQAGSDLSAPLGYVWIADTGTDSAVKIDSQSGQIVARYRVAGGSPSHVAVNLEGDVAVLSREPGAITKIIGDPARCPDVDRSGEVDTSTGPNDLLPLGQDECVAWTKSVPSPSLQAGPRASAWQGQLPDPETCEYGSHQLWFGWRDAQTDGHIELIAGADGATLQDLLLPEWSPFDGPYSGVANDAGDLYVMGVDNAPALLIGAEDLSVTDLGQPEGECKYSMTMDLDGNLWISDYCDGGIGWFDTQAEQWNYIDGEGGNNNWLLGVVADAAGNVWGAGLMPCRLAQVDVASKTFVDNAIELPGCDYPAGVAVDAEGDVWVIDRYAEQAYEVDPETYEIKNIVAGFTEPYAFGDMTGVPLLSRTLP